MPYIIWGLLFFYAVCAVWYFYPVRGVWDPSEPAPAEPNDAPRFAVRAGDVQKDPPPLDKR